MWKNGFSPICAPHGLPHVIFSFFSDRMCWVECSFTYFMQEIMNFFIFYSIFFHYLCPFQKKYFLAHLPPFNAPPPHGPPPTSCGLVLYPHIPWAQPTYQWHCGSKKFGFLKFLENMSFWPFLAILPPEDPPSKCLTEKMRALGNLLRVPSPAPDLTPSPKSR